jgi:hypothetical protein
MFLCTSALGRVIKGRTSCPLLNIYCQEHRNGRQRPHPLNLACFKISFRGYTNVPTQKLGELPACGLIRALFLADIF